jgi:hypothetical protein
VLINSLNNFIYKGLQVLINNYIYEGLQVLINNYIYEGLQVFINSLNNYIYKGLGTPSALPVPPPPPHGTFSARSAVSACFLLWNDIS